LKVKSSHEGEVKSLSSHKVLESSHNSITKWLSGLVGYIGCCMLFLSVSGDRYIGGGATDRRGSLYDCRCVIRTGLLPFW